MKYRIFIIIIVLLFTEACVSKRAINQKINVPLEILLHNIKVEKGPHNLDNKKKIYFSPYDCISYALSNYKSKRLETLILNTLTQYKNDVEYDTIFLLLLESKSALGQRTLKFLKILNNSIARSESIGQKKKNIYNTYSKFLISFITKNLQFKELIQTAKPTNRFEKEIINRVKNYPIYQYEGSWNNDISDDVSFRIQERFKLILHLPKINQSIPIRCYRRNLKYFFGENDDLIVLKSPDGAIYKCSINLSQTTGNGKLATEPVSEK